MNVQAESKMQTQQKRRILLELGLMVKLQLCFTSKGSSDSAAKLYEKVSTLYAGEK